jgi:TatA/E family protein of Tat protein translocase
MPGLGMHWPELLVLALIALLIFGPKRLPEMGSAVGKTFLEFKKSFNDIANSNHNNTPQPEKLPPAGETTAASTKVESEVVQQ